MFSGMKLPVIVAALSILAPAAVNAAIVTDTASFSVGMGYIAPGMFSTAETALQNTPTTAANNVNFVVGNFTIKISATAVDFGSDGLTFTNRVPGNNAGGSKDAGNPNASVTVTATYTGPALPGDAYDDSFLLSIDQFSIYVMKHTAYVTADPDDDDTTFYATETTAGNTGQSGNLSLVPSPNHQLLSSYQQLVWNPNDFAVNGGTTTTRTFGYRPGNYTTDKASVFTMDNLEIIGSVSRTYSIPEPASLGLLALGAAVILGRKRSW